MGLIFLLSRLLKTWKILRLLKFQGLEKRNIVSKRANHKHTLAHCQLSLVGQKTTKYLYKIFLIKHILRVQILKQSASVNFLLKLSIKIRVGKAYAYQILLSFKTSVTHEYFFFFTSRRTTVSVVKQLCFDITQFFPGIVQCPRLIFRPDLG